jgi:alkanesulfonate monooxygenase SsuD/methylene tetrahydromethanopterin reductase-like flavin-dependent oxidoreductase (luciferase family)
MQLSASFMPTAGRKEFEDFLESVRAAERAGFDHAWVLDSQLLWGDLYIYLSHALEATDRLVMGAAVTNPVTRDITVTASAHVTLSKLYPGRVLVGIGRGNTACTTIGLKPLRLSAFDAAMRDLKALVAGDGVEMNGVEARLAFADGPLPLVIPATGPKMLHLAGQHADVVHLDIGADPDAVGWAIRRVHEGARAAGRDPATLRIGVWAPIYVSDDQQAAWAFARLGVENQLRLRWSEIGRRAPDVELPDAIARLVNARTTDVLPDAADSDSDTFASEQWRRDYPKAEGPLHLSEEIIDEHVVAGPPAKCIERLQALNDAGAHELCAFVLNNEFEQIRRLGEEVIPQIRDLAPPTVDGEFV